MIPGPDELLAKCYCELHLSKLEFCAFQMSQPIGYRGKTWFPFGHFCLLLLVLVFHTNKILKRAKQFLNGNIYKKTKRATKSQNEQPNAFACFGFSNRTDSISENKNEQRRAAKSNERQMETRPKNQNEQQKATKRIFTSLHSFA